MWNNISLEEYLFLGLTWGSLPTCDEDLELWGKKNLKFGDTSLLWSQFVEWRITEFILLCCCSLWAWIVRLWFWKKNRVWIYSDREHLRIISDFTFWIFNLLYTSLHRKQICRAESYLSGKSTSMQPFPSVFIPWKPLTCRKQGPTPKSSSMAFTHCLCAHQSAHRDCVYRY